MKYCDKCGEGYSKREKKCPKCNCEISTNSYIDEIETYDTSLESNIRVLSEEEISQLKNELGNYCNDEIMSLFATIEKLQADNNELKKYTKFLLTV